MTLRFSMLGCLVWLPFAAMGCGGKSSDVDDETAGDSDASSDGATGTGGSQGDSDADSSSDGTSSSGDSGGSGGTAGSTSAGDGSDGAGDTTTIGGGTGPGDTSSSGGSTTGSVNPSPPMDLVQGCAQACLAETGSDCPSAPSASDCSGACLVITRIQSCNDVVGEFFECVEENDTTSCSDDGDVVFDACVSEQLAAYACIVQNAPDAEFEEPCETYCSAQAAAECELSDDVPGCVLGCTGIPTALPTCKERWRDLLDCTLNHEFTCDANGEATVSGCAPEYAAFLACAYPEITE